MKAKQRVPVPRARAARHFGCQGLGCDRIWLRRRVNETENHAQQSGIWGMSAQTTVVEEVAVIPDDDPVFWPTGFGKGGCWIMSAPDFGMAGDLLLAMARYSLCPSGNRAVR